MTLHAPTSGDKDGTLISSVGDPADVQAAMGFAGLIVPDIYLSEGPRVRTSYGSGRYILYGSGDFDGISPYGDAEDDQNSFFPSESERIPPTDPTTCNPSVAQSFLLVASDTTDRDQVFRVLASTRQH